MADCKETSLSLVPLLYNPLFSLYNIEELIASLQTLKSTSKSLPPDLYRQDKIQKWEVIKLKSKHNDLIYFLTSSFKPN